jgi:hypothetical protein
MKHLGLLTGAGPVQEEVPAFILPQGTRVSVESVRHQQETPVGTRGVSSKPQKAPR